MSDQGSATGNSRTTASPNPLLPPETSFEARLQAVKLQALAEFAAGAGHEINNPLATIIGHAQLLLAGETDPERRQALATIGGQAYRIRDMIGDLMLLARPPAPRPQPVELALAVQEVIASLLPELRPPGQLELQPAPPLSVMADPVQLRVVLGCLLRNSLEATTWQGTIRVSIAGPEGSVAADVPEPEQSALSKSDATSAVSPLQRVTLRVSDNGPGLTDEDLEHLFDPFYSGRPAGRGLGFGLCKTWVIVQAHGGEVSVRNLPEGGAEFTLLWPVAE